MIEVDEPTRLHDVAEWDRAADVVVVGLGVAGACAALEAHRAGVKVLVVERASGGGGASETSEGIFYLGGGTALQVACGYEDSPEEMYRFIRASTTTPDDASLRLFCDGAREHFDWLEAQGVPFERRAFTGKAVAVRTGEGLLTTGNEKVWPFAEEARPAPRGHQARGTAEAGGGASAMQALLATVAEEKVPVIYDSRVTALVIDDDGAVRGVRVRGAGCDDQFVEARRGVILATGSFNLNDEMTARYLPVVAEHGRPLGTEFNDGVGVLMGESVGVATRGMEGAIATASIYPPEQLVYGIIVNANGERFVAEDSYHGRVGYFTERQPDQIAYLIIDDEHFAYPEAGHKLLDAWSTVAEMEEALGVPAGSIGATLEEYNRDVAEGEDRRFHKHPSWLARLDPPFAAFDLSFSSSTYAYISLGGLTANEHGQALDAAGEPVAGLYVVGAVAAHFPQNGGEYASGLSLGPGSFFGRMAGRHAASQPTSGS